MIVDRLPAVDLDEDARLARLVPPAEPRVVPEDDAFLRQRVDPEQVSRAPPRPRTRRSPTASAARPDQRTAARSGPTAPCASRRRSPHPSDSGSARRHSQWPPRPRPASRTTPPMHSLQRTGRGNATRNGVALFGRDATPPRPHGHAKGHPPMPDRKVPRAGIENDGAVLSIGVGPDDLAEGAGRPAPTRSSSRSSS